MSVFLGTHQNRLDAKGRVSIPASFRTILRARQTEGEPMIILRPSHTYPCIEGWPTSTFMALDRPLERLDLFGEQHDDFAAALYADAFSVDADKEGRIMLPGAMVAHAGLTDSVAFMGLGRSFQIWEPAAGDRRRAEARLKARAGTLPAGAVAAGGTAAP